jgi:hypothetical protein
MALVGLAIGAYAWPGEVRGQGGAGVSLTSRDSQIGSNGRVVGPDGQLRDDDPKSNAFSGAGSFSDSKSSQASYDDLDGHSGQATGAGSQTSTVTVDSTGLAADVDAGIGATASISGVPSQAQGLGQSMFEVTFTVDTVTDYALEGSRTLPAQGEIDIRFAGSDVAGASFNASGTLQPGTYSLQIVAEARAEANTFFGLDVHEPPSNGHYQVSLRVGENVASATSVAIGSGPSGTVNSRSATFEFTTVDPNPPAGQFECRVDGQPTSSSARRRTP